MFSTCMICLQQTLAATNSAEQVESTLVVCWIDAHIIGVQFTKMVRPETLILSRPTAKEASVYTDIVKRWETGRVGVVMSMALAASVK